jgi:membrane protein YqaA with SNARE-associated domain
MDTSSSPAASDNLDASLENTQQPRRFGPQHAVALLLAIAIPVLIYLFRAYLPDLRRLGYLGAFLTMFIGNATVIFPIPGLVVVLALSESLHPILLGLSAGAGAALGELTGYFAGYSSSGMIKRTGLYQRVEQQIKRYGPVMITALAIIPNPAFDIVGLVSGALGIRWWQFLLAVWVGKTIQATVIASAGYYSIGWVLQLLR